MPDLQSELMHKGFAKKSKESSVSTTTKGEQPMTNYFYTDQGKKILREELLTIKARDWALKFINPERPGQGQKNPKLTSAQLRRFYQDTKSLEAMVNAQGFDRLKPLVKMLKSKVAYACSSDGRERKVPLEFRTFIEEMVNNINDPKDFKAFMFCFESVVGYFYGEGGR